MANNAERTHVGGASDAPTDTGAVGDSKSPAGAGDNSSSAPSGRAWGATKGDCGAGGGGPGGSSSCSDDDATFFDPPRPMVVRFTPLQSLRTPFPTGCPVLACSEHYPDPGSVRSGTVTSVAASFEGDCFPTGAVRYEVELHGNGAGGMKGEGTKAAGAAMVEGSRLRYSPGCPATVSPRENGEGWREVTVVGCIDLPAGGTGDAAAKMENISSPLSRPKILYSVQCSDGALIHGVDAPLVRYRPPESVLLSKKKEEEEEEQRAAISPGTKKKRPSMTTLEGGAAPSSKRTRVRERGRTQPTESERGGGGGGAEESERGARRSDHLRGSASSTMPSAVAADEEPGDDGSARDESESSSAVLGRGPSDGAVGQTDAPRGSGDDVPESEVRRIMAPTTVRAAPVPLRAVKMEEEEEEEVDTAEPPSSGGEDRRLSHQATSARVAPVQLVLKQEEGLYAGATAASHEPVASAADAPSARGPPAVASWSAEGGRHGGGGSEARPARSPGVVGGVGGGGVVRGDNGASQSEACSSPRRKLQNRWTAPGGGSGVTGGQQLAPHSDRSPTTARVEPTRNEGVIGGGRTNDGGVAATAADAAATARRAGSRRQCARGSTSEGIAPWEDVAVGYRGFILVPKAYSLTFLEDSVMGTDRCNHKNLTTLTGCTDIGLNSNEEEYNVVQFDHTSRVGVEEASFAICDHIVEAERDGQKKRQLRGDLLVRNVGAGNAQLNYGYRGEIFVPKELIDRRVLDGVVAGYRPSKTNCAKIRLVSQHPVFDNDYVIEFYHRSKHDAAVTARIVYGLILKSAGGGSRGGLGRRMSSRGMRSRVNLC